MNGKKSDRDAFRHGVKHNLSVCVLEETVFFKNVIATEADCRWFLAIKTSNL
jgi:hypothetical protein